MIKLSLIGLLAASSALAAPQADQVFIKSGAIDLAAGTVTLPLFQGSLEDGRSVWYVITDASDRAEADRLGVEFAPQISGTAKFAGTRAARKDKAGRWVFKAGTVDFKPRRALTPGEAPDFFPPKSVQPGSVADADYSPFVRLADNGVVYNAPILAFDTDASELEAAAGSVNYDIVHDKVVSISASRGEVTVRLTPGLAQGRSVVYLSFDASVDLAATMEAATLAPALAALKGSGANLPIYAVANGVTGVADPNRQGFNSALSGEGSPLNVLSFLPGPSGYSPLWDLKLGVWTGDAIAMQARKRLTSATEFKSAIAEGDLFGPSGTEDLSTGIQVNCPVVAVLK